MSHLSSEIYPSKFITSECTNHFSSLCIPKDFRPQFELETKDSRAEELLTNPNQGNPVDRYGRSSQAIFEVKYYSLRMVV
ncbi:hypothetical protein CsatB_017094 [Cannabis sativa]